MANRGIELVLGSLVSPSIILPLVHRIVPIKKNHHIVPIGSIGSTLPIIVFFDQQTTPMWSVHDMVGIMLKK